MKTFREITLTEKDSSASGFEAEGQALRVTIQQAKYNNLMEMNFYGSKILTTIKSSETFKSEYREEDWNNIDKIYNKIMTKASSKLEKSVKDFEKVLNSLVIDIEKEINKIK